MKLGYLAIDERSGQSLRLTEKEHPRKQLLAKIGVQHASKMYVDSVSTGQPKHVGYVAGGGWWNIYEVHAWAEPVQRRD